ncbi:MAG: O-antigen ligase family protein [Candidatus Omnitrophica bacterium]|nr:O-antigen ligase family protein [Candidatus Omnitrophota bacterium]
MVIILAFLAILLISTFIGLPVKYPLIFILGSIVFSISFFNTDLALIILIFSMLLSPEYAIGEVTGRAVVVRADDVFLIVVFLGWIAKMAIKKELGLLKTTPLNIPIFLYIITCLISSFIGIMEGRLKAAHVAFYVLKYVEYFLLFFMVSNNLRTTKQAKKFVAFLLLTCFLVCVYALTQTPLGGRVTAPFEGEGGEPNTFAGYLLLMTAIIIAFILYPETEHKTIALIVLCCMAFLSFLLTLSRGGWLSFLPMLATFIILDRRARLPLLLALIVGVVLLPLMAPHAVHKRVKDTFAYRWKTYRVFGNEISVDKSVAARIDSWGVGFQRWKSRPILGYGVPAGVVIDNQYTRVLNETGVVGLTFFAWILIVVFRTAKRVYSMAEDNNFARAVSLGFMAGFIGLLAQSASAAVFVIIRIMEPFWFLAAIIVVLEEMLAGRRGAAP